MDDSLAYWLRVREPIDRAARSRAMTRAVVATLPADQPIRVLDLATGAGSNIRYLAERLPMSQHWLAVDKDPELLAALRDRMASWGTARGCDVRTLADGCCVVHGERLECRVETRLMDLGALDDLDMFAGRHLVTASALLDLVSESWLQTLTARCRAVGAAALLTISYNGQSSCDPAEPEDDVVRELLNRHQLADKGLGGPAAGPAAETIAERCFADAGYNVAREASDWNLSPADADVQRYLMDGWAKAATQLAPERAAAVADWLARRRAHLEAGRSRITVGHTDLAAWLPDA